MARRSALDFSDIFGAALGGAPVVEERPQIDDLPIAPAEPIPWLRTLFPRHFSGEFAPRHVRYWDHLWSIQPGVRPLEYACIWPRGGAKTTGGEGGVVSLGVRGVRRYGLYVKAVQKQADQSVENIARMLESPSIRTYYPAHADRAVSKYGTSRGWSRSRLRTAGGLTVDAVGLDGPVRGLKDEEVRPDFIVIDDIDERHDTPATTQKKIDIITTSILPAGSPDVAVLLLQNLIIESGFFAQLADGSAGYLQTCIVDGPEPAVIGLETERRYDPALDRNVDIIVAGTPTWEGQNLDVCQAQINAWGLEAFKREAQHEVKRGARALALQYVRAEHDIQMTDAQVTKLAAISNVFAGIDFQLWRFSFNLFLAVPSKAAPADHQQAKVVRVDGLFSQNETLLTRAKAIDAIVRKYGIRGPVVAWGDAANPQDIVEINQRFIEIGSKVRCVAVGQQNKLRRPGVERLNDLLHSGQLLNRIPATGEAARFDTPMRDLSWWLHRTVDTQGVEMEGVSRWVWEAEHWSFPLTKPGEAQDDDPDDDTADGGDAMASTRYGVMSWWKPAKQKPEPTRTHEHQHPGHVQTDGRLAVAQERATAPTPSRGAVAPSRGTPFRTPRK